MSFVIASQVALWVAILILGVVCIALARQVGVLHQRIAPADGWNDPVVKPATLVSSVGVA